MDLESEAKYIYINKQTNMCIVGASLNKLCIFALRCQGVSECQHENTKTFTG